MASNALLLHHWKPEQAARKIMNMNIEQVAEGSSVNTKMIRYYESIGLIVVANRTSSGHPQFISKKVQTLRFIKRSRDLRSPIKRIKTLLAYGKTEAERA